MKKFGLLVLKIILFCLLLKPAYASEPIKIGLTLGLTGKYAVMSNMQMKGFKLWEQDINSRGGLLGRKVRLIIYDDKSSPDKAISLYKQLINVDKVDIVFGPYSSELTEAVSQIVEQYRYPMLAQGGSADSIWQKGYRYVFGVYIPASKYAVGFLELLAMNGFNNIAIVYADDSFSVNIAEGTKKWADRFGLRVSLYEGFKKDTNVLDHIAKKAKDSGAEALIVCGHFDEAINMRMSLKRIGWHPKAYYASVGPALDEFHKRLLEDANGVFSSSQWEHQAGFPGNKRFFELFKTTYRIKPSYHAAAGFAAGQILESAVKKAMNLDREKIRGVLSQMDAITIIGRYGVDTTGRQIRHFNLIIQWQKGKKEIVWPEELRTAKPIFK